MFFNTGIFLCTAIFLYMFADRNLHGFQLLTRCFIILSFFPFFSFSEKLRDELKEYPEETKTKGMKKASSYGSDINRSATLPRSHGVSLILSLRYNFWKSNYSPVSL